MTETYQMLYDKYDMVAASTLATATNYNARDILTRNVYQKLVPENWYQFLVRVSCNLVPVSVWYQILVPDRTCSIQRENP